MFRFLVSLWSGSRDRSRLGSDCCRLAGRGRLPILSAVSTSATLFSSCCGPSSSSQPLPLSFSCSPSCTSLPSGRSRESRILASNRASPRVLSCGADGGSSSGEGGGRRMTRPSNGATGSVREGLKRGMVEEGAARGLYRRRKRRPARARALPDAGAAKPGGADTTPKIISRKSLPPTIQSNLDHRPRSVCPYMTAVPHVDPRSRMTRR
jgi:hypothetical protein